MQLYLCHPHEDEVSDTAAGNPEVDHYVLSGET